LILGHGKTISNDQDHTLVEAKPCDSCLQCYSSLQRCRIANQINALDVSFTLFFDATSYRK